MGKKLVIVESPAKARTIGKFLGNGYMVLSSYGHIRALPSKQGSVDLEHDFEPKYRVLPESKKHIAAIRKELKNADGLLLATDLDREGEAISWHLLAALGLDEKKPSFPIHRVVFHEVTKEAVLKAIEHPRDISANLVDAQQARVVLDYLVGFNLSPFLWEKIRYGLSAGRVQSVALRLVCEREKEIQDFVETEYWTIEAEFAKGESPSFTAGLVEVKGRKLKKFDIARREDAQEIVDAIEQLRDDPENPFIVDEVARKTRKRRPSPPFTTSTLQQDASRKLGFSAKKTMFVAQRLYEGIDLGSELVGLITYMRTDSVILSRTATAEAQGVISTLFGKEYTLAKPRVFKNKAKNVQEAHEAIRPTYLSKVPEELRDRLTPDQFKLYDLIWKRTVASQMAEALLDQTSVDIVHGGAFRFRVTGTVVRFPGFMKLYTESTNNNGQEKEKTLPPLAVRDRLQLRSIQPDQHFTQPPPRYSEASLVKKLEEYGIGRPSTYASIMNTLVERKYAQLVKKRFIPEDIGLVVNNLLVKHFTRYVDYDFTASLEEELDQVSRGEKQWKSFLREFWFPFISLLDQKGKEVTRRDATTEDTDEPCPECGKLLVVKLGKFSRFYACSGYPDCTYTRPMAKEEEAVYSEEKCEKCQSPMLIRSGRYGKYLACSGYPDCRNIQPLVRAKGTGVTCPSCGQGELAEKKSRRGRTFFSCDRYPSCTFALWDKPLEKSCPKCGFPVMVRKSTRSRGEHMKCPRPECGHTE